MKKILPILIILAVASWVSAQPLPEFPALDSGDLASTSGLPDMPPVDSQPIAGGAPTSLPDLPPPGGDPMFLPGASSTSSMSAGLPDLPPAESVPMATTAASPGGLPELPAVESAPAVPSTVPQSGLPELPASGAPAPAPGLPPLPGEQPAAQPAAQPALPALPAGSSAPAAVQAPATEPPASTAAESTADATKKGADRPVAKKPKSPWAVPPPRHPNAIFGGLVTPKGRGEEMHLAWSSQEILNAMLGNKYELLKEEGEYNPGGWREFTFRQVRTKRQVQVFVKAAGRNKVWMRVGPGEPPAGVPLKETVNVRKDAEMALKILKKQFGKSLAPRGKSWEAPYDRSRS